MSLLKKASIITTPTAYAEDFLYNIKPAGGLGDELVTNGTFNTDSNWTMQTGWTISGGKANGSNVSGSIYQSESFVSSKSYKVSFDITSISSGQVSYRTNNTQNYFSEIGTHTITFVSDGSFNFIYFLGDNFTGSIDNVSVKEVVDFSFDRNSTGTRLNEDYLIEDVPYNLSTYSEDFNSWAQIQNVTLTENATLSPIGTGNATKVLATSTSAKVRNNFTCQNGVTYTFSIFCKNIDATTMTLLIYDGSASYSVDKISEVSTDAWSRISISFTATQNSTSGQIQFARDLPNGESAFFWGAQLVKGDQPKDYLKTTDRLDIPRIDYTNGEPSILLEPSRTNLITYSQDFTQWNNASTSLTANQITSPDGTTTGSLVQSTGTGTSLIEPSGLSLTVGVTYTYSVFVKKGNNQWVRLAHISSSATGCWFDLDNGVLGTVNSTSATIDKYPNGWYRITNTFVATSTATGNSAFIGICDNNGSTNAGVIGQNVYIYGAQVEEGSYATSLIHTSGSAVTRSADAATNAGNSDLISSTEGVLYGEIDFRNTTGNYISISNAAGNRIIFGTENGSGRVYASSLVTYFTIDYGVYNKIAFSYKANERKLFINGQSVYSSTATYTPPTGMNELSFDSTGAGSQKTQGNVKMVAVFKEALTDLELACLTGYNNHELYMNYYNRLSYLGLVEEYNVESDINNYIL